MGIEGWRGGGLDPDRTATFGQVNPGNSARELLRHHARSYPPALIAALGKVRNGPRSKVLDQAEVDAAVRADFGDALPEGFELKGFSVRGDEEGEQVLTFSYAIASGRTAKGALPYDRASLPKSGKAGDRAAAVEEARDADPTTVLVRALELATGKNAGDASLGEDDEELDDLRDENADLREQLDEARQEAEKIRTDFEERLSAIEAGAAPAEAPAAAGDQPDPPPASDDPLHPEPWDGYQGSNADVVVRKLREDGDAEMAARVLAFEEQNDRRRGVVAAANAILDRPPS